MSVNISNFLKKLEELDKPNITSILKSVYSFIGSLNNSTSYIDILEWALNNRHKIKRNFLEFIYENVDSWIVPQDIYNDLPFRIGNWKLYLVTIKSLEKVAIHLSEGVFTTLFEVGMALDPIFNLPYIPSSSIKGAFRRSYEKFIKAFNLPKVDEFLGSPTSIGSIGFTDAYPIEGNKIIYPDIITPHYKNVKTELDVSPTPIPHLVINKDVKFKFILLLRPKYRNLIDVMDDIPNKELEGLRPLTKILLHSFAIGVGARTSYGYSRFIVESILKPGEDR